MEAAGFACLGSVEIEKTTRKSLEENFGPSPLEILENSHGDIRGINPHELKKELFEKNFGDLDVLVACPPCQGFSRVGRGKLDSLKGCKGSFHTDSRNRLYLKAIQFLEALQPKVFIFENVPGMMFMSGRNVAEIVCKDAAKIGYRVKCALLNAAWYGVPQLRERLIIIGFRNDLKLTPEFPSIKHFGNLLEGTDSATDWPHQFWDQKDFFVPFGRLRRSPLHLPLVSVKEALEDLPPFTLHLKALKKNLPYKSLRTLFPPIQYVHQIPPNDFCALMRNWNGFESSVITDHFCRWTPRDFGTFAKMKPGDRYGEACVVAEERYHVAFSHYRKWGGRKPTRAQFIPPYRRDSFNEKWRKLFPDRPSWTLTAHLSKDCYSHIHFDSKQARSITIREAARLQSFPDAFMFHGNMGDAFRQIGNAVPPLLAYAVGNQVFNQLQSLFGNIHHPKSLKQPLLKSAGKCS